jgi:hypothetical protein
VTREKSFIFDSIFTEFYSNLEIFNLTVEPLIANLLDGYNVTCFSYGMTGAGKTHTMLGD